MSFEGGYSITVKDGQVVIVLGKNAYTLTMTPEAALRLGDKLTELAVVTIHENRFGKTR